MSRQPKPWYRKDRRAWFVTIGGVRHNLGGDKKAAMKRYYELMRSPNAAKVPSKSFAAIADSFLDWVKSNRAPDTFEWYRYRLERFCQRYPDLPADQIRPFHVQEWVDAYPELTKTSRRNYVRSVKRCTKWARQLGYTPDDPIADMAVPGAESRETCISGEEFATLSSYIRDETFLQLCRVTFESGCRPQEILRVEARHFDERNARWVMPVSEAKGKKKPRIVYLTAYTLDVTRKLVAQFPEGKLFRNSRGKPWTTESVNCAFDRLRARMGKAEMQRQGLDLKQMINDQIQLPDGTIPVNQPLRVKVGNAIASQYATRYSLYALRHSWATRALQSGVDALTVAILMGHNDPSTLSRVYQHLAHNPEHMRAQAKKAIGE